MTKNILMIAYFFDERDGVGSLRSITLNEFLNRNEISTRVINRKTFGELATKSFLLWSIIVFIKILFSREKKVYISCGPFQQLFFVTMASFITRKELIVDFRDPWSLNIKNGYNNMVKANRIKVLIAESIEKISYKVCKNFIVCTEGMRRQYSNIFKNNEKIIVITNGYDFNFNEFEKIISSDSIDIVCLGKFAEYDMNKAISTLQKVQKLKVDREKIKIHFIGSNKKTNSIALGKAGLEDNAIFYPHMEYKEAMRIASRCKFGILILRDEDLEYGTKVFDYIGLRIHIFDNFNSSSIFKNNFKDFLCSDMECEFPIFKSLKFKRENIYSEYIDLFR